MTSHLGICNCVIIISTHTLTWSVTKVAVGSVIIEDISTHTLTWSVTFTSGTELESKNHFNSHAHVERDLPLLYYLPLKK